ncbi:molybdenum cofactor guanylyltransferase MobA [Herbaspirillum sp. LeCh32-8]|uniref:molybdenum cofactor guanylyltransferase MobA n=1 Tax=Herbaspirillum sp. LeCh32-8 TaxID=2821356 RepID=UPI001AE80F90|nr:molybdenum cofactor guanylyltransferase MobA [Herbaspirillum sp. LeCh32-8]MBP0596805.1 molybdenum cofactor guanylyltransferase MobA [Herbaspirillum sp. LeCh32-8]
MSAPLTIGAIAASHITGLVLAGGRGTRMGGVDKGLQELHGKPLAQHVLERLAPQVCTLAINANRSQLRYAAFGYPIWHDLSPDFPGPLAGLQAGLAHCGTPFLASAPCDSPLIPYDLVARLADELVASGADAAFAVTGKADKKQRHPVCSLLRKSAQASLDAFLAAGERKMGLWFASLNCVEVDFPDEHAFRNINTGLELQQLEQEQ